MIRRTARYERRLTTLVNESRRYNGETMSKDSPFSSLSKLKASLPMGPERETAPPTEPLATSPLAGKIVVAKSRKGRGGKTVTLVGGVTGSADECRDLARELGKALGCGASLEEGTIVVQGEHTLRVKQLLEARGAKRIVVSG